jgi:hypothetical protein
VNTYRALTPAGVAAFADGVFERDFTVTEEKDWLASGVVELVPRTYKVLSTNYEQPLGTTFDAAFLIEVEASRVAGGHIERVAPPAKPSKAKEK